MTFSVRIPFAEAQGFELIAFGDGAAEIAVTLRDDQTNSMRVAHGGLTMTLLDVAMAHATREPEPADAERPPESGPVVTIEMKTSFMRPGTGRLVARARLIHRTASLAFCEGSVFDAAGQLVAHATGTFKYVRGGSRGRQDRPPAAG